MTWQAGSLPGLTDARQALKCVRSGNRIWIEPGCATPLPLVTALVERGSDLRDVEVVHMMTFGEAPYARPEFAGHIRHNGLFIGSNVREAVQQGHADYTPIFLSEIEGLFTSGAMPLDVVLMQVSPPDAHGFVSMGTSVDCTLTAARCARYVIAEMNDQMPRTHGDCFLHVSKFDAVVRTSRPLLELKPEPSSELQYRIARNVASLIHDGATLQTGVGGIPDAVLHCLMDRRDIGIHTEMFSDGVIPLIEAGVINGERKSLHRGKLIAGFVLGTRRLFDFIHENPLFEFRPIHYTNDPFVIAGNDNMIAINSALEVDLTGQICSDSLGTKPYSGVGGQVDFMRGAARSKGGRPIIALPSTARNGSISRIVATLTPGAGVVTSRADVHYIVTEHGIAYLHGKTVRQRAEALIAIADPRFQHDLERAAFSSHHVRPSLALAG
jgi:acyl-CoA hydrolase